MHIDCLGSNCFHFHKDLTEGELNCLIDSLVKWTGGAPRPLLYTCHMLEMLHGSHGEQYKWAERLNEIFNMLIEYISEEPILVRELGPVSRRGKELSKHEQQVYHYFIFESWLGNSVKRTFKLPTILNGNSSTYLRSFNVFAKAQENDRMKLVVPSFVSALLEKDQHVTAAMIGHHTAVKPEGMFEASLSTFCQNVSKNSRTVSQTNFISTVDS